MTPVRSWFWYAKLVFGVAAALGALIFLDALVSLVAGSVVGFLFMLACVLLGVTTLIWYTNERAR